MNTSNLSERYVHEVVRRLPTDQRAEVADELRATIADTVDAREASTPDTPDAPDAPHAPNTPDALAAPDAPGDDGAATGNQTGSAEYEVLREMGDPIRLAARYTDRRLALIGPEVYPTYVRLLTVLLTVVLPVVVLGLLVVDLLDGAELAPALGSSLLAALVVGPQMIAWVTVVFAVAERVGHRRGGALTTGDWTPDDLPERRRDAEEKRGGSFWLGVSAVVHALLVGLIVWQQVDKPYPADDERVPVLNPDLWSGWMWPVLAGLAGIAVLELARLALRAWTPTLVAWYTAAHAVFALPTAWLLSQQLFVNDAFLTHVNGEEWTTPDALWSLAALGVLLWSAVDVFDRVRDVRR